MEDSGGKTCKLCQKYIECDENMLAALSEEVLGKLKFLQMDFVNSIQENNSLCADCKEKIENAFDFKSSILKFKHSNPGRSGDQTQNICDIPSTSSSLHSNEKTICHLCKRSGTTIPLIGFKKLFRDDGMMEVFQCHLPEVELKDTESSMICNVCQNSLAGLSTLISLWSIANNLKEDEDIIDHILDDNDVVVVKREDIANLSDPDTDSSCSVDINQDSANDLKKDKSKSRQITNAKSENYDRDSSSGNGEDATPENGEDYEESEMGDVQLKNEEVNIKDEDGNQDQKTRTSKNSNGNLEEVKTFKCQICSYAAKVKSGLKNHMLVHKSLEEVPTFECHNCSFITKYKATLAQHMAMHKSLEEVKTFKCKTCPYITKWRGSITKHINT